MAIQAGAVLMLVAAFGRTTAASPVLLSNSSGPGMMRVVRFILANKPRRDSIRHKPRSARIFSFTESEVNSFVREWIDHAQMSGRHRGVVIKSAQLHFEPDQVVDIDAVAHLDAGALKQADALGDSFFARKLKALLSIDNSVHLKCMAGATGGFGRLSVQEAKIAGVPIPSVLVREALVLVGRAQHPRLDFAAPLPMPNGIEDVDIMPGLLKFVVQTF